MVASLQGFVYNVGKEECPQKKFDYPKGIEVPFIIDAIYVYAIL